MDASFFHVDSSHDLGVTFNIDSFGPAAVKFPPAETFRATAKTSGTMLSLTETMTLTADLSDGNLRLLNFYFTCFIPSSNTPYILYSARFSICCG